MTIPHKHTASTRIDLKASPADVWRCIDDLGAWPHWNKSIKRMERRDAGGKETWVMADRHGELPSEVLERTAPSGAGPGRLVTRIADETLPFGGTWTWEIQPTSGGTTVVLTEDGEIRNAFFRFLSYYVLGYTGTQRKFLAALARKFGDSAEPVVVASGK